MQDILHPDRRRASGLTNAYAKYPPKAIDDPNLIVVLMPTRDRPELLRRAIQSFDDRAADPHRVEIWVMVDDDDPSSLDLIRTPWRTKVGLRWSVAPRPSTLAEGINALWQRSSRGGIYVHSTDDYAVGTDAWDLAIRRAFDRGPADRLLAVQIDDAARSPDEFLIWGLSAQWANVVGRFMPPYFPFWFTDMWTDHVSAMSGRQARANVVSGQIPDGIQPTISMWNLPFWFRFFHALHDERVQEAEAILTAAHGASSAAYAAARRDMEPRAQHLEKLVASMLNDDKLRIVEKRYAGDRSEPTARERAAEEAARTYLALHDRKLRPGSP